VEKINLVGTSESGKSHFNQLLAYRLASDHIEMDQLFWGKIRLTSPAKAKPILKRLTK